MFRRCVQVLQSHQGIQQINNFSKYPSKRERWADFCIINDQILFQSYHLYLAPFQFLFSFCSIVEFTHTVCMNHLGTKHFREFFPFVLVLLTGVWWSFSQCSVLRGVCTMQELQICWSSACGKSGVHHAAGGSSQAKPGELHTDKKKLRYPARCILRFSFLYLLLNDYHNILDNQLLEEFVLLMNKWTVKQKNHELYSYYAMIFTLLPQGFKVLY